MLFTKPDTRNSPAYAAEDAFCRAWVESREAAALPIVYTAVFGVHFISMLIEPFVLGTQLVKIAWVLHGVVLPILAYGVLRRAVLQVMRRALAVAFYASVLGSATMLYFATHVSRTTSDIVIASAIYMGVGMFTPQLFPGGRRELTLLLIAATGIAALAMKSIAHGWVWAYIYFMMVLWSLFLNVATRRSQRREAEGEYRFRRQVVPEHIVRHTANAGSRELSEVFRPEEKFCLCISSDWRNYQELCSHISTARLTSSLNAYYALCQDLIRVAFPLGNYYTDWIADELFVVAYLTEETSEGAMTEAAARFALELLAAKVAFHAAHGLPARIDVGIAAGPALLGLMGPDGHRKATALGEIPGRARRLQGAGKIISRRLGERDRLIMDASCQARLPASLGIERFVLENHETIRDLKDREIFHASVDPQRRLGAGLGPTLAA